MDDALSATPFEASVIQSLLTSATYEDIARAHGCSRGRVYAVALKYGARKYERRIQQRRRDREAACADALKEMLGQTVTADVCDFLALLPDNSVQLHVTSPPYNIGKPYAGGVSADCLRHVGYLGWLVQIISEVERTLRPGGTVVFLVGLTYNEKGERFPLNVMLDPFFRMTGLTFQNSVVWPSQNGLTPKNRLKESYEVLMVFSKGEPRFNPNAIRIVQKNPGKRAYKGPNRGKLSGHPLGAWPTDIWNVTHLMHNHPEKSDHPAAFPKEIPKRAILAYTTPGDLVCDMFCGDGASEIAAIEAGRAFVGCDASYKASREARVARACVDTVSWFSGVTEESMALWAEELGVRSRAAAPVAAALEQESLFSTSGVAG